MPILSDIEIIKSAILFGDLDDAMSVVSHKKKAISYHLKGKHSQKLVEYNTFLEALERLLRGESSIDAFRNEVEGLTELQKDLDITGDREKMLDTFCYFLEYSMDRYNVRFPAYDGKRCDDK